MLPPNLAPSRVEHLEMGPEMGRRPLPPPPPPPRSTGAIPQVGIHAASWCPQQTPAEDGGHTGPLLLLSSNGTRRGEHHPETRLE